MRIFLVAVRLLVLSILLTSQLIADAHADSAASVKCIDIPDGLSSDDLIALCNSVMETEKDLPAARLAKVFQARGVGYLRKKEFDKATADFKKALEILPAGSDENLRQILMVQQDMALERKKAAAEAETANSNNWLMFLVYVAGVCGIWAISFRTRIGALAYGTSGRIPRSDYWFALLTVFAVATVQWLALAAAKRLGLPFLGPVAGPLFFVGWMATILLAATAVSIKRLHDRNRAAWTLVVPIAAVLGALLAQGSLLAEPTDGGPFSGPWKHVFDGSFAAAVGGLTPAGPVLIAVLLGDSLGIIGGRGVNLVLALGSLLALAASLWHLREVGFLRGTAGPNSYGTDPLGAAAMGNKWTPRISPRARRYAAAAAVLIALGAGLYAFAPWRMLSHAPDQVGIEASPEELCRLAREEMKKDTGLSPKRESAAETAVRACTIVIGKDASADGRSEAYRTRSAAYEILHQKEKAIADTKEAEKLALFDRCGAAGDEFGYEWKPRPEPAKKVIGACTAFIDGGGAPEQLADAYFIRAKGYTGLGLDQKAKAIADLKKAYELSRIPMYACGLARLGVSGYSCEGMTPCGLAHLGVPGYSCEGGGGGGGGLQIH